MLDNVDYPDSSSSSDSEGDAYEEFQCAFKAWENHRFKMETRLADLNETLGTYPVSRQYNRVQWVRRILWYLDIRSRYRRGRLP
jgi:hypothetical protein